MSPEYFPMSAVFEGMASFLLSVGMDDFGEKDFAGLYNGSLLTLQVKDMKGELGLQVVGKDSVELAEELVLACLHNISIEHLGALHLRQLNKGLQVHKGED